MPAMYIPYDPPYCSDTDGCPSGAATVPTGGTTGQVLTKDSNADFDTSWQTASGGSGADHQGPLIAAVAPYSPQWYIDRADFVVDPFAFDFEVAFNAALALVNGTSTLDGEIYLAPGIYIASTDLDAGDVSIHGVGNSDSVAIYLNGCLFQTSGSLYNLEIGAAGSAFGAPGYAAGTQVSLFSNDGGVFQGIKIQSVDVGLQDTLAEIQISNDMTVSGIHVLSAGFDVSGGNPIVVISGGDGTLRDSLFEASIGDPVVGVSITADGGRIVDSLFLQGTVEIDVQQVTFSRNRVASANGDGIHITTNGFRTRLHENYISRSGQAAPATYSGVFDEGTRTNAQLNLITDDLANAKYGYNVGAAAVDVVVTNNDLRTSGTTANFVDAGTGTITTAGNNV